MKKRRCSSDFVFAPAVRGQQMDLLRQVDHTSRQTTALTPKVQKLRFLREGPYLKRRIDFLEPVADPIQDNEQIRSNVDDDSIELRFQTALLPKTSANKCNGYNVVIVQCMMLRSKWAETHWWCCSREIALDHTTANRRAAGAATRTTDCWLSQKNEPNFIVVSE